MSGMRARGGKPGQEKPVFPPPKKLKKRSENKGESVFSLFRLRFYFYLFFEHKTHFFAYLTTHTRQIAQQQRVEAGSDWSLRAEQRAFGSLKHVISLTKPQA